ncbi:hypothetical protein DL546_003047 [Coniochaeta pulveracea]|uniref:Uncharacterized protein n=1 Tax=Coniochaeta pulveracea TaxID=177199 RepID=A0A420Y6R6_9PEZI|nr:hypothetical protein DL546_003047 [Coniochaeta pulveracea]
MSEGPDPGGTPSSPSVRPAIESQFSDKLCLPCAKAGRCCRKNPGTKSKRCDRCRSHKVKHSEAMCRQQPRTPALLSAVQDALAALQSRTGFEGGDTEAAVILVYRTVIISLFTTTRRIYKLTLSELSDNFLN